MRSIILATSLLPLCFAGGWLLGTVDLAALKKAVVDSYVNRYNTVSGINIDEILYYVVSEDRTSLETIVQQEANIKRIENSGYPDLYNVYLNYSERRSGLKKLRQHAAVSAVFTVPFLCH